MTLQETVDRALLVYNARTQLDKELEELKSTLRTMAVGQVENGAQVVTLQGTNGGKIVITYPNPSVKLKDHTLVPSQYIVTSTQTVHKINSEYTQEILMNPNIQGIQVITGTPRVGFRT